MLYVFSGFPECGLSAGGLAHCVEEVESLATLEHDPMISYAKEGVYSIPRGSVVGERLGPVEYRLSPSLDRCGIDWDWFPKNHGFGNMISIPKTTAIRETMLVDWRTGCPVNDLFPIGYPVDVGKLIVQRVPKRIEGWDLYEKRWRPGMCPQESHIVHLTWLVTRGEIAPWAYSRLERIIEDPSLVLTGVEQYQETHFTPTRKWNGETQSPVAESLLRGLFT